MAQNENNYEKEPNNLTKGLHTDNNQEFQPDSTYTFALNAIMISDQGEKLSLINEEGNSPCVNLLPESDTNGTTVAGSCLLSDGTNILFLGYDTYGMIAYHYANCVIKPIIKSECLRFNRCDTIDVEYKIHNGCDTIIYFTDDKTKYKSINLSKLNNYVKKNEIYEYDVNSTNMSYSNPNIPINPNALNPSTGQYGWDCSLFNFNPDYSIPKVELVEIKTGGRLRIGAYFVSVRYLDSQLNPTNWISLCGPIYITEAVKSPFKMQNHGGYLSIPEDGYYYANKSIVLDIKELDRRYTYYQISVLELTQNTDTNNLSFVSNPTLIDGIDSTLPLPQPTRNSRIEINSLSALNGYIPTTQNSIIVPNEYIDIVKAHTQQDNRLIIGNLKSIVTDWSSFQQKANLIGTEYFTFGQLADPEFNDCGNNEVMSVTNLDDNADEITIHDRTTEYNDPKFLFDYKTFMRDEVYSLGIVWIFKNGQESPVFHIPGRKEIDESNSQIIDGFTYTPQLGFDQWGGTYDRRHPGPNDDLNVFDAPGNPLPWDRKTYLTPSNAARTNLDYGLVTSNPNLLENNIVDVTQYVKNTCAEPQRWQFLNTSIANDKLIQDITAQDGTIYTIKSSGALGYFETDTDYPKVYDCNNQLIFEEGRIRHHRIPDSRKEPIFQGYWDESKQRTINYVFPLGLKFSNIQVPEQYRDQIQGYYIVRGDRAGNKTVIDKGWLNVCDNTKKQPLPTTQSFKTVKQSPFWMSAQFPVAVNNGANTENAGMYNDIGFDYVEFFSPKTSYAFSQLDASHFKFENTIVCSPIIQKFATNNGSGDTQPGDNLDGPDAFRVRGYCETVTMMLPRMWISNLAFTNADIRIAHEHYSLQHTLPIFGSEYALYNQSNMSIVAPDITIENTNHRQRMYLSKVVDNVQSRDIANQLQWRIHKPLAYGIFNPGHVAGTGPTDIAQPNVGSINQWITKALAFANDNTYYGSMRHEADPRYAVHMFYVAIKSDVIPYRRLQEISYIKCNNNLIKLTADAIQPNVYVLGGDCFITRQHLTKSYYRDTDGGDPGGNNGNGKLSGTTIVGYTESEINAHFRNKKQGDDFFIYPWDTIENELGRAQQELHDNLREFMEIDYDYRLDYSADNKLKKFNALPDAYEYCAKCTENFPNTIKYSEQSLNDQVSDLYKILLAGSVKETPTETGEITNMFVKSQNLFVHTKASLWRYNLSPQQLDTNNDSIQIGSGTLLEAKAQKMFDNNQGYGRGGTEFKFASTFCDDYYIWVDNVSRRIFAMTSEGIKELSSEEFGISRWFKVNLDLTLRKQFEGLPNIQGVYKYPILNTSCEQSIGFISCYDPEYNRYILHKRDFELTEDILDIIIYDPYDNNPPISDPNPYILDNYYYNSLGFFRASSTSNLKILDYDGDDKALFKNKSWTLSYSIADKCWVSFHSYRPNSMFNNNDTFYTTTVYSPYNQFIWKHNVKSNYQTYYRIPNTTIDNKFDFVVELLSRGKDSYMDRTFDTIEYNANVFGYDAINQSWIEKQFITFDKLYAYNNNQITGLKGIGVKNQLHYADINYNTFSVSAHKDRNIWKINRLRDYSVNKLNPTGESMFTTNWANLDYSSEFKSGVGYVDKVINPAYIDLNKPMQTLDRLTDKILSSRLYFKPQEDYKIVLNLNSNLRRYRI